MKLILLATLLSAGILPADDEKDDALKPFQGSWTIVDKKKVENEEPKTARTVMFEGDKYKIKAGDKVVEEGTFTVDGAKKHIEVTVTEGADEGRTWHGIYEVDGDTMKAVVGPITAARPTEYDDPPEGVRSFVLKRENE